MSKKARFLKSLRIAAGVVLLLGVGYAASIAWRVSVAEKRYFGHSELIPMALHQPKHNHPSVPASYGSRAFIFMREGKPVLVWKQKINAFQHVYGSALMASELGGAFADFAFCGNEWAEAIFDHDGITERDFRDRRKDLYHNRLGREMAASVGDWADYDARIQRMILSEMEMGDQIILHPDNPKVDGLESEAELHCPGLPTQTILQGMGFQD